MDTYPTLFAALLAFGIGLGAGILRQRAIDETALDQLAAENRQLRKRLTVCDDEPPPSIVYVYKRTPTAAEIAYGLELERWLEVNDVDEYLMRDRSGG